MRKEQNQQNSRNLYTRSVRLYCQPKRGRGWEESERGKGGKSGLKSLFIQLGVMGVIFNSCSSASCIILGFDSIMFLPFYILILCTLSYVSFLEDLIYDFHLSSLLPIHTHTLSLQLQLQGWDTKHHQGPLRVQTRD